LVLGTTTSKELSSHHLFSALLCRSSGADTDIVMKAEGSTRPSLSESRYLWIYDLLVGIEIGDKFKIR
jgi:hypothetical protein